MLDTLTDGTHYTPTYVDHGVKFISVTNVTENEIDFEHTKYISEKEHADFIKRCNPEPRNVLLTKIGSIGRAVVIPDDSPSFSIFVSVALLKTNEKILPEYLCAYLNSALAFKQFERHLKGIGVPDLHLENIAETLIVLPPYPQQVLLAEKYTSSIKKKKEQITQAKELLNNAKNKVFETFGISFAEYAPALYSFSNRGRLREMGIYCNPHSDYLNTVFSHLRENEYYAGNLEDFVEINPTTSRTELQDDTPVAFVPMPAVEEKTNVVSYEIKPYKEVKTGFTVFQTNDLLWAKITPCMQNGKSFIASDMPTEIGFGSTEFHVLRKKNERIYMPYLWVILSDPHILEAAQGMFGGSAGQQRVPDTFLKKLPIVLPPIEIQKELADNVMEALKQAKEMRDTAEQEWQAAKEQFEKELLQ